MRVQSLSKIAFVALCWLPMLARADVFINEIHYDDSTAAGDVGEAIEVVATAGEDLTNYSIVLYNGSVPGAATTYDTDVLPAGALVTCGTQVRIAAITYATNGVQNGAPDGVALVGPGNTVIQLLSYEGALTASNGPAMGMVSTDIGVSETNSTAPGTSLQLGGNAGSYAGFTWNTSASATMGACNNNQTFTGGVDQPPTLAGSIPANNAPSFPTNANLQVSFSESVDLGPTWFQLVCSLSGVRNVSDTVVGGSSAVYTINPLEDFDQTETCTLTLDPIQIADRGGMAQQLSGSNTINFTVGAAIVNDPPVVLATTPINGDSNFPAAGNLTAMFSETVNLLSDAFTLSCAQSGSVELTYPSSGMSFSIDTATALIGGESCTFTIVADHVSDLEGAQLAANVVVVFTVRVGGVGSYYDQVNTSSPEQLRCSLHQTIRGHTEYPYGWDQLEIADEDPLNSSRILDIYRNCSFNKVNSRVGNGGPATTCGTTSGLRYNREHVWPRSLGFRTPETLAAHNDQHMLHLSDETFNAHRGNKPFDTCTQASGCIEDRTIAYNGEGGGNGTYPGLSNWYTSVDGETGSYEVWSKLRGNMARAIFYMAIRYEGGDNLPNLELTDNRSLIVITPSTAPTAYMGILTTLLQWHQQDPVDARELDRNEVVFNFQSNRNPFVDHPEWATLALFQSANPTTCLLGSGTLIFADGFGS